MVVYHKLHIDYTEELLIHYNPLGLFHMIFLRNNLVLHLSFDFSCSELYTIQVSWQLIYGLPHIV